LKLVIKPRRRSLLKWLVATVLVPWQAIASNRDALQQVLLLDLASTDQVGDIEIIVPAWAENGEGIKVEVMSRVLGTEAIALFAEKNAVPLLANFTLSHGAQPYIMTRIRLAQSQSVEVVVKANGQYYKASRYITVLDQKV